MSEPLTECRVMSAIMRHSSPSTAELIAIAEDLFPTSPEQKAELEGLSDEELLTRLGVPTEEQIEETVERLDPSSPWNPVQVACFPDGYTGRETYEDLRQKAIWYLTEKPLSRENIFGEAKLASFQDHGNGFSVLITGEETREWATSWPCSVLEGKTVRADYDTNGLLDLEVSREGGESNPRALADWEDARDVSSNELNALVADFVAGKLPKDHPCYFVAVGQFA